MKKIMCITTATMFILGFIGLVVNPVSADSENVTTEWVVPGDTTITISYPNSETQITFDATGTGKTFSSLAATAQTADLAALRVTNDGNQALEIEAKWSDDWPTNVTDVNVSITDNTNSSVIYYGAANETTNQTWVDSLAIGASEDFWFWTCGTEVEQTEGVQKTLIVYSKAAS